MEKTNDKAKIMASLLRNKTVSKAFSEAMASPMGSTKRQKAAKLASVLRKTITKYDGKGGPGIQGFSQSTPGTHYPQSTGPQASSEMGGMVIFTAPPSPYDGQGGPGYEQLNLGNNPFNLAMGGVPTLGSASATPYLSGVGKPWQPSPFLSGTQQPGGPVAPKLPPQMSGFTASDPGRLTIGNPYANIKAPDLSARGTVAPPSQGLTPAPSPQQGAPGAENGGAPVSVPEVTSGGGVPTIPTDTSGDTTTDTTPPAGSFPTLTGLVKNSLTANQGPSTFAYGAMNDINVLRELMPGVPDDQLPVGASLTGQLVDLKSALKKEYDIEGLTNRLNEKLKTGITLDTDLKDFIRGKDEYLNEVDGMLSSAKRSYLDKSGGPDAGVMSNYVNYLTTLKGRQNKRYIEFYNGAITAYNGELTALQNQLQTSTAGYESELQDKSAIKQDDYNRIFGALTEMYNAAADAPRKQMELAILNTQLATSLTGIVGDTTSGVNSKWVNEFGNLANQGVLIDKDTKTFLPSVSSLEPVLETIISNGETDLGGAARIIGEAISNDLATGGDDVNAYMKKVKKYEQMLIDFKNASMDPSIQAKYGADFSPAVDNLAANLAATAGDSISTYILSNSKKVKEAFQPLAKGGGMFGWGGIPNRESYIKSNGGGLSPDMLGKLYDYYGVINAADPRGTTMKSILGLPDADFARTISTGIGQTLFGGVAAAGHLQGM